MVECYVFDNTCTAGSPLDHNTPKTKKSIVVQCIFWNLICFCFDLQLYDLKQWRHLCMACTCFWHRRSLGHYGWQATLMPIPQLDTRDFITMEIIPRTHYIPLYQEGESLLLLLWHGCKFKLRDVSNSSKRFSSFFKVALKTQ